MLTYTPLLPVCPLKFECSQDSFEIRIWYDARAQIKQKMISKLSCNCRVATRKLPARHSAWQKSFPFSPVQKFLFVLYICHWLILWQNVQNTSARTCLSQSNSVRREAGEPSLLTSPSSPNVFWLWRMFFCFCIQKVIVTLFFSSRMSDYETTKGTKKKR